MISRYDDRITVLNRHDRYKELIENRGLNFARHFNSPNLRFPTEGEIATLTVINHYWAVGDRYYKLASQFYGNPRYWWIIAHYNKKPTEADLTVGDIIYIPTPLEKILNYVLE